jgi:hypothetical protein
MTSLEVLARSAALWNRERFDLRSEEMLAQILDRGSLADWRALYELARADPALRGRIVRIARSVPIYLPHFWLAAMHALDGDVSMERGDFPFDPGGA